MRLDDNHDVEKIEDPNALDNPAAGKVSEPDLRRLLRSVTAVDAADVAIVEVWRRFGLVVPPRADAALPDN